MMPIPQLPTETWEQIIDWIPLYEIQSDRETHDLVSRDTLWACSLVCWSWVPRSQFHLFVDVHLSTSPQHESFHSVLSRFPSVGQGTKSLTLSPSPPHARRTNTGPQPNHYNWVYTALTTIPRFLTRLQTLVFLRLPVLHPSFVALASQFKPIRNLELSYLENHSFTEIIRLVNRFPQIQTLDISNSQWSTPGNFGPTRRHRLKRFWVNTYGNTRGDILRWMSSSIMCFSELQNLTPKLTLVVGENPLDHIFGQCFKTLKYLMLDIQANDNDDAVFGMYDRVLFNYI